MSEDKMARQMRESCFARINEIKDFSRLGVLLACLA